MKIKLWRICRCVFGLLVACGLTIPGSPAAATQTSSRPFSLPFNTPPGPSTWFVGQQYGNTVGAFNFGPYWYGAGQGLHFGVDFNAPCGTDVVAVADGVVQYVDNFVFGLQPHNLVITHSDLGYASLYGHLNVRPTLQKGQPVKRGQVIAKTGDPDVTCTSRPHLHLEIRDAASLYVAFNPATLIDADWPMLSMAGQYGATAFVKDLYHPRRWQTIDDQPQVHFQQATLNRYRDSYPPLQRIQPPAQTLPGFDAPPIPKDVKLEARQLTELGCCSLAWWSPDSQSVRYFDGPDGQLANIVGINIDDEASTPADITPGPLKMFSPDGSYQVQWDDGIVTVTHVADKTAWRVNTDGVWPRFSPESKQLLWQSSGATNVPGTTPPDTRLYISAPDGKGKTQIATQKGGSVSWLDEDRLLLVQRRPGTLITDISIYTISTRQTAPLGTFTYLRGMSIAPGGKILAMNLLFQTDAAASGMYLLETTPGAVPQKLPFFGSMRWRDSTSAIYIPFMPGSPAVFMLYDVTTGKSRQLTDPAQLPFSIANDDWSVSPDGQNILYWDAGNLSLKLIALPN